MMKTANLLIRNAVETTSVDELASQLGALLSVQAHLFEKRTKILYGNYSDFFPTLDSNAGFFHTGVDQQIVQGVNPPFSDEGAFPVIARSKIIDGGDGLRIASFRTVHQAQRALVEETPDAVFYQHELTNAFVLKPGMLICGWSKHKIIYAGARVGSLSDVGIQRCSVYIAGDVHVNGRGEMSLAFRILDVLGRIDHHHNLQAHAMCCEWGAEHDAFYVNWFIRMYIMNRVNVDAKFSNKGMHLHSILAHAGIEFERLLPESMK